MSSELERRLEGLFAEAPEPDAGAEEEALHRALRALHPAAPARRGLRTAVLVFAAAAVLLGIAAGSLARLGGRAACQLRPQGEATAGDHAARAAKGSERHRRDRGRSALGRHDRRLPAAGASRHLRGAVATRALRRGGDRPVARRIEARAGARRGCILPAARSSPLLGRPSATESRTSFASVIPLLPLHVIWGTGTHDATIDRRVRAIRPRPGGPIRSRSPTSAPAGKQIVYDVGHRNRSILAVRAPVTGLSGLRSDRRLRSPWNSSPARRLGAALRAQRRRSPPGHVARVRMAEREARRRGPPGRASSSSVAVRVHRGGIARILLAQAGQCRNRDAEGRRRAEGTGPHLAGHTTSLLTLFRAAQRCKDARDRLARRPKGDRDVASRRRDLRRPEPVQCPAPELQDLAGEERRRHDLPAERREVERAVRHADCAEPPVRPPQHRLEGGSVTAREQRPRA